MITVRTLRADEAMPQNLGTGFEQMPVMKDFVWVAEDKGRIVGALLAAPCHGIVFIVRLCTEIGASPVTVRLLFMQAAKDCMARGFSGYFTYVDPSREAERRFIPICRKAGGLQMVLPQVALVGKLEQWSPKCPS